MADAKYGSVAASRRVSRINGLALSWISTPLTSPKILTRVDLKDAKSLLDQLSA
jgi:hypothetical protein